MPLCRTMSLVNGDSDFGLVSALKCKCWDCGQCQVERRKQLIAQACSGVPTMFVTLTSRPRNDLAPDEQCTLLARAWRLIVKRAKRKYNYAHLPYFAVVEATKAGQPHLHILVRAQWIDQRWLSDQMREITGDYIVDVRRIVRPKEVVHYVAKYIGKAPHKFGSSKRYWQSRDYQLVRVEETPGATFADAGRWRVVDSPLWRIEASRLQDGYEVEWLDPTRFTYRRTGETREPIHRPPRPTELVPVIGRSPDGEPSGHEQPWRTA